MTTSAPSTVATVRQRGTTDGNWLRLVHVGIGIGIVGLVTFAYVSMRYPTSSGGDFTYTADYWYTASGLPIAVAGILLVFGVHSLQHGADGRLGAIGAWLAGLAMAELFVQLAASVLVGAELRWGPMYVLSTALNFVGIALLAAGSWRTHLLPKWLLGPWPLLWVIGSFAAVLGWMPLVLAGFLVAFGMVLTRNVEAHKG